MLNLLIFILAGLVFIAQAWVPYFPANQRGVNLDLGVGNTYNILQFGAVGDGITMNTKAFEVRSL